MRGFETNTGGWGKAGFPGAKLRSRAGSVACWSSTAELLKGWVGSIRTRTSLLAEELRHKQRFEASQ